MATASTQDSYKDFSDGVIESFLKLRALKLDPAATTRSPSPRCSPRATSAARAWQPRHEAFGFDDVVFVDVDAVLNNDTHAVNRTLVIKTKDGQWYAHPTPELSPVLSDGLDDESPSTQLLRMFTTSNGDTCGPCVSCLRSTAELAPLLLMQTASNPLREGLTNRAQTKPCVLVIFGATGDLTHRKLIPALYNLAADGDLPPAW